MNKMLMTSAALLAVLVGSGCSEERRGINCPAVAPPALVGIQLSCSGEAVQASLGTPGQDEEAVVELRYLPEGVWERCYTGGEPGPVRVCSRPATVLCDSGRYGGVGSYEVRARQGDLVSETVRFTAEATSHGACCPEGGCYRTQEVELMLHLPE